MSDHGTDRMQASTGSPRPAKIRGSVTAELAVVLPAVTVLLALLLLAVSTGMLQLRLEEGARAGARALARGDSPSQVAEVVARVSGDGVSVALGNDGGYATVTVQGRAGGALSALVPWTQSAQAMAKVESAAPDPTIHHMTSARFEGSPVPAVGDAPVRKSSLWRWVRTTQCPLRNGHCEEAAIAWKGAHHGNVQW
ncbi:TadE family type IV pilus minor pilin [Arthrobacter alpinus]|uniref:TadE family type IV pilus minor pilin n=1 Tax=Arthrobacter alpinus TaxID=656366 RepID=UPI000B119D0F|nr:TadE family type IV pilus minor pilin [Arthrobacter alpinus]